VFDSVSVVTTFKEKLREVGVIFCPFSEAREKPANSVPRATSSTSLSQS